MPLFDKKDKSRYVTFTRRTVAVGGGMTAVFAVLTGRLYQLQIREGDQYKVAAEDNRISERLIVPPRGRIIDRFGTDLATNRRNYRLLLVAEQTPEGAAQALDNIGKIIVLTDDQKSKALRDIAQTKKFVPVPVVENLSWDEFSRINLHLPYLPGVQPDVGDTRDYPFGPEMVHILGYVAAVSQKELKEDNDPLLSVPGYRIGKRGIERQYEKALRGRAGASRVEVNAYGRTVRELGKDPGVAGQDVWLTIDRQVQQMAAEKLASESAACVVMDVNNGDVIALTSTPGFDPNLFNTGMSNKQWQALLTNDHKPLLNKTVDGVYPPGSTFKPAVALAAIEAGIATPDYRVHCSGALVFGGHTFHCWKRGGHGWLDVEGGLQHSCDVFFYETARRVGIDRIAAAARKLGMGALTGIELPGEQTGLIPTRAWKERTYHQAWQQGDTLSVGIGQGYVTTTPLQLCVQAARIASGRAVSPRLVHSVGGKVIPRPLAPALDFDPKALTTVRSGLNKVMNEIGGTAYTWRITEPGMAMAGKTGTAQVRNYSREEHARGIIRDGQLPWRLRDHGLFIGFAPVDNPRYAIVSVVEHGAIGHPQVVAAHDIMLFCQQRNPARLPTAWPLNSATALPSAPDRRAALSTPRKAGG